MLQADVEPWQGVRDATAFGASCIQPVAPAKGLYSDNPEKMSEDCLTLNVWRPAHAKKLPVIVWIYGGALWFGGSAEPMYDGANFARKGVVLVSISYRVGVLGFLATPDLSRESGHGSGNYGLLDQLAGLQMPPEIGIADTEPEPRNGLSARASFLERIRESAR